MAKRFVGQYTDLVDLKSESYGGKRRYFCPYCDSVHGKSKDNEGSVMFDMNKMSGYCFRCNTIITHDGLMDLGYMQERLANKTEQTEIEKANKDKININWLQNPEDNKVVMDYLISRNITLDTIKKFDVKAFDSPFNGVAFYNKVVAKDFVDYLYMRGIDSKQELKHTFVKNVVKKPSWLNKVDNNEIVLCEGFFDGLAIYQHGLNLPNHLNPVVLSGKIVTNYQLYEIKKFVSPLKEINITVCMDGGFFEDTLKIADKVYQSCYNVKVYVMILPYGKDPNEVSQDMFLKSFKYRMEYQPSRKQYIRNKIYGR